jgi:hypothetical protein
MVFTGINVVEEMDYKRVADILDPYLTFLSNHLFRGLYLLFIASLIMTASHSFLLFSGAFGMTTGFLYMILWGLRHLTSHESSRVAPSTPAEQPSLAPTELGWNDAVSREEQDQRQRQLERQERERQRLREEEDEQQRQLERQERERQRLREEEDERQRQLERQERERQRLREEEERQRRNRPSTFYHATNLEAALLIQDTGFRVPAGPGGCLGPGVYCTATLKKAFDYLNCEHGGIIFELNVDLGRCLTLQPNDPRMKTWQEDFDSAWHPTGAVNDVGEEKEENCVKDPRKIKIVRPIVGHTGKLGSAGYKIDRDRIVRR